MNNPAPAKQDETACLYAAQVGHRRLVAPFYAFKYQVFYLLLDIDHIAQSAASARFFSHNRFNLLSFHDRDHGAETQGGLRDWAEGLMQQSGIEPDGGRIRLLVMPRLLGYAFNPISLWYCEGRDGSLRAVIAEVRNTFKEKHSYLLASAGAPIAYETALEKEKCFHVSPFFDLNGRYRFELGEPSQQLRVHIHDSGCQPDRTTTPTAGSGHCLAGAQNAIHDPQGRGRHPLGSVEDLVARGEISFQARATCPRGQLSRGCVHGQEKTG